MSVDYCLVSALQCLDAFTKQQSRLVGIVDALDSCDTERIITVLSSIQTLLSSPNRPFVMLFAVDPHVIAKAAEANSRRLFTEGKTKINQAFELQHHWRYVLSYKQVALVVMISYEISFICRFTCKIRGCVRFNVPKTRHWCSDAISWICKMKTDPCWRIRRAHENCRTPRR